MRNTAVQLDRWGFVITDHALVHAGDVLPGYEQREPAALETMYQATSLPAMCALIAPSR